jgi:tetratricopeptide (TPR) repeat protein
MANGSQQRGGSSDRKKGASAKKQGSASKPGGSGSKSGKRDYGKTSSGRYGKAASGRYGKKDTRGGGKGAQSSQRAGGGTKDRRRDLKGAAVNLPNWVVEELTRITPKERVAGALEALGEASAAFSEGRYHQAMKWAEQAKAMSSRDATTRELLGLSAYRVGDWGTALRELRTYRRLAGETTHMPVEMDCLRALGRRDDVGVVWEELQRRGGRPGVLKEGKVVYASMLIDGGAIDEARRLVAPRGLKADPFPEDLRLWYVAARAAALDGDPEEARRLRNAILAADPGFPGIDELESLIAAA